MDKINFKNLPDTTTPVNAQNLNLLQTNVENEMPRAGNRSASLSWNDLLTEGRKYSIETINGKTSGATLGEGAPPDAYDYGTLISLNPRQTTESAYDQTQIYITDGLNNTNSNRGIWVRKRAGGGWIKLIGNIDRSVAKSDAIQVYSNSRLEIPITEAWKTYKVPLNLNRNTGTAFSFDSSNKRVICNKAGVIDIFASFNWFANSSPKSDIIVQIYKGNTKITEIAYFNNTASEAKYLSVSGFGFGIEVSEGDIIEMRVSCGMTGTVKIFENENTSFSLRYRRE